MQMEFVPAHLYKARASELQHGQRFRLDCAQAYLYKPEHQSCKSVSAVPAVALGYTCAWLPLSHTQTLFKHICTRLGIGDPITATRPLTADSSPGTLYKPEHQSSKNVYAPAAVARRSPT